MKDLAEIRRSSLGDAGLWTHLDKDPSHLQHLADWMRSFLGTSTLTLGTTSHQCSFPLTNLQDIYICKVAIQYTSASITCDIQCNVYRWANQAPVTIESFSLRWPNSCGLSAMTTTAFCTVLRVTSAGRLNNWLASICLVHDIPNAEVGDVVAEARLRSVKYEKSSVDLIQNQRYHLDRERTIYA